MDTGLDDDLPPRCDQCGAVLVMTPDQVGNHVAVRLDCPEHGLQLMWVPFGDDGDAPRA